MNEGNGSSHGGKREGSGRKSIAEKRNEPVSRVPVTLSESQKEFLQKQHGGIAPGIRDLIDADMGRIAAMRVTAIPVSDLHRLIDAYHKALEQNVSIDAVIAAIEEAIARIESDMEG